MTSSMVNVRLDESTKKGMAEVCGELGISMSAAFNIFAKTVVRERRIPFEVTADPFYSAENMARVRRAAAKLDAGQGTVHGLIEE
ncbi:type II toxin-antitoxin system RelB/DinJ family antitoxin [Bifidobacterium stellenboschense]|uniref:RelB/DinJ family addiction module antitoxin n=1 Tax=Bifidobacterium stellenboschense TaxID=762211 RepID=A0A087DZH1_9BIFI|nr:type II toxin-antitoxin system RelB/DinJ family antitoxin [Bifidobacterium stellenboschense]KFJ00922.1 RelB/DinJ family addiction module antitoxin [Bifidobacterium stellenboschense]